MEKGPKSAICSLLQVGSKVILVRENRKGFREPDKSI